MPAGRSAILSVKILSDASGAAKGFDQTTSKLAKFEAGMGRLAAPAAIALGAVVAFGKGALDAASRTQQAMGGVEAVFGSYAATVKRSAESASTAVGLSAASYGELAAAIGAQLKNAGVPMDQLAGKTDDLIKLGADLAATYGGTTAEAVQALGSALRGEADPAERYGLALNQTAVNAELAAKGQDNLTGKALAQAKAAAIVGMATKQSAGAIGQFARESDSAAGSAQIAAASWEDAQSALGTALLPAASAVAVALADVAHWLQQNQTIALVAIGTLAALAAAVLIVNAALKVYRATLVVVNAVQKATWLTNPITLVILAIVALVAAVVLLWNKNKAFRDFVLGMWAAIKTAAGAVAGFFRNVWVTAIANVRAVFTAYKTVVTTALAVIRAVTSAVAGFFRSAWNGAVSFVRGIFTGLRGAVTAVLNAVRSVITSVSSYFRTAWNGAVSFVRGVFSGLQSVLTAPFRALESAIRSAIGMVQNLLNKIGSIHLPDLNPFSRSAAAPARALAPAVPIGTARSAGAGPRYAARSTAPTIQVNGAANPQALARDLTQIIGGAYIRTGWRGVRTV